jgi:hypothetical protein
VARSPAERQAAAGAVERSAGGREAEESRQAAAAAIALEPYFMRVASQVRISLVEGAAFELSVPREREAWSTAWKTNKRVRCALTGDAECRAMAIWYAPEETIR